MGVLFSHDMNNFLQTRYRRTSWMVRCFRCYSNSLFIDSIWFIFKITASGKNTKTGMSKVRTLDLPLLLIVVFAFSCIGNRQIPRNLRNLSLVRLVPFVESDWLFWLIRLVVMVIVVIVGWTLVLVFYYFHIVWNIDINRRTDFAASIVHTMSGTTATKLLHYIMRWRWPFIFQNFVNTSSEESHILTQLTEATFKFSLRDFFY